MNTITMAMTETSTFQDWMDAQPEYDDVSGDTVEIDGKQYVLVVDGQCAWITPQSEWDGAMSAKIVEYTGKNALTDDSRIYTELCNLCHYSREVTERYEEIHDRQWNWA